MAHTPDEIFENYCKIINGYITGNKKMYVTDYEEFRKVITAIYLAINLIETNKRTHSISDYIIYEKLAIHYSKSGKAIKDAIVSAFRKLNDITPSGKKRTVITSELNAIKNAQYGYQMREAIVKCLKKLYYLEDE